MRRQYEFSKQVLMINVVPMYTLISIILCRFKVYQDLRKVQPLLIPYIYSGQWYITPRNKIARLQVKNLRI